MRSLLALTLILAACGDDEFKGLPDGPVFPDTPGDMTTAGLVTLTITVGTAPRPDIRVYFQNSDSTLVFAGTTDENGFVSAVMEPGGFVTAIDPFPPLLRLPAGVAPPSTLKTFAGVEPGDELVLHERERNPTPVNFTLVALNEPGNAAISYQLHGPCLSTFGLDITHPNGAGSGDPGGAISLQGCASTTDLTVVAFDVNGQPIKSFTKTGVVVTEGGTVDLSAETYVDVEQAAFTYSSVPGNVALVNVTSIQATTAGPQFHTFNEASVDNGTATTSRARPVIGGALQITGTQMFGSANGIHNVLEWGASTTDYQLAMGNILTPTILLQEYTALPTFDIAQKAINWTVDSVGREPDLIIGSMEFQREGQTFLRWFWDVAAPAGSPAVSLRYPVLPAPDDQFNPTVADSQADVREVLTARVPGGYDTVRENVFAQDDPGSNLTLGGLVAGASGQVVFQEVLFGKGKRDPAPRSRVLSPFADRLKHGGR